MSEITTVRVVDEVVSVIGTVPVGPRGPKGEDGISPDSVMTTDGDLISRAGGAPVRITRAQLAADSAFSGFAPKDNPTFTGNVVVPTADAPTEAVNKAQMESHTAQFAPIANPTFTGNVVVPTADASNEAACTTAIDAATGRMAINGVELGDTGWRKVFSWTGGVQDATNQIASINLTAWTPVGTGYLAIRRIGRTVLYAIPVSGAGLRGFGGGIGTIRSFSASTWVPSGFSNNGTIGSLAYASYPSYMGATPLSFTFGSSSLAPALYGVAAGFHVEIWTASHPTDTPWPSTLPGVPV